MKDYKLNLNSKVILKFKNKKIDLTIRQRNKK